MDDTVKVEEPMVEEPAKEKKGKGLILGIIGVLIAALVGIGVYLFLVGPKTNVYLTLLDKYSNSLLVALDKANLDEKKEVNYEASLNITGGSEISDIANVLNKIKIKGKVQSDTTNKIMNGNVELFYNNKSTIDGSIYMNNKDIYLSVESLYDKLIKLPTNEYLDVSESLTRGTEEDYKLIVKRFTDMLKKNLKDEYFSISDETINILGKDVKTSKQTLTLTYGNLEDMGEAMKADILKDEALLSALGKVTGLSVEELKEVLTYEAPTVEDSENSLYGVTTNPTDVVLSAEVYINKGTRNVEQALIKSDDNQIEFVRSDENIYAIKINSFKYGTLYKKNDEIKLTLSPEGMLFELAIKENEVNFKYEMQNSGFEDSAISINVLLKGNEDKGVMTTNLSYMGMKVMVNLDYNVKNIKELDKVNYSNYIDYDKLTDADTNSIMIKLNQNKDLVTFIQDINGLSTSYYN